jgi:hypothetical protein
MRPLATLKKQLNSFSDEELHLIEAALKKEKVKRKLNKILKAVKKAKKAASENELTYFSTAESFLSFLNEDKSFS